MSEEHRKIEHEADGCKTIVLDCSIDAGKNDRSIKIYISIYISIKISCSRSYVYAGKFTILRHVFKISAISMHSYLSSARRLSMYASMTRCSMHNATNGLAGVSTVYCAERRRVTSTALRKDNKAKINSLNKNTGYFIILKQNCHPIM